MIKCISRCVFVCSIEQQYLINIYLNRHLNWVKTLNEHNWFCNDIKMIVFALPYRTVAFSTFFSYLCKWKVCQRQICQCSQNNSHHKQCESPHLKNKSATCVHDVGFAVPVRGIWIYGFTCRLKSQLSSPSLVTLSMSSLSLLVKLLSCFDSWLSSVSFSAAD